MGVLYYFSKLVKKLHLPAIKRSVIDHKAKVCTGAHVVDSVVGRYSYVGNFTTVLNCSIGSFCSIADNCTIGGMAHPVDWVSTSPTTYAGKNCLGVNFSDNIFEEGKKTVIDHDVWIGDGCFIKAGVHIATGSVVGMGSVLTKDTKPYEVWAGNPARKIKDRFDEETVKCLLATTWWEWSDKKLQRKANAFNDIEEFVKQCNTTHVSIK